MSIYGSELWKCNRFTSVKKQLAEYGKITCTQIKALINKVNRCAPINVLLEKRCIQFFVEFFQLSICVV